MAIGPRDDAPAQRLGGLMTLYQFEWILGLKGGQWYAFWSGAGGPLLTLAAAILISLRWFNCDERRCWRRGRYQLPDSLLVVCRKHWESGRVARLHDPDPVGARQEQIYSDSADTKTSSGSPGSGD